MHARYNEHTCLLGTRRSSSMPGRDYRITLKKPGVHPSPAGVSLFQMPDIARNGTQYTHCYTAPPPSPPERISADCANERDGRIY
ncbi:decaprenyl-diphosphate synthase subunit 1 [Moniliophthora roreri]|nr:decaprenyl-diphosphate synthase subunit 1 [Moniliophthora roreri]